MSAASARYRIHRRLGQGGMAEVFEAELVAELGFSRKVAIKRMLAEIASDDESARRFLDEARIASKLHHANIVAIVDFGRLEGLPFQVLELVDGIDAQALAGRAGGVLPEDIALIIASAVAHALDHAHTACGSDGLPLGIVHRDVKPSNVLVSWGGDVKLTDFGIALAHDRAAKTEVGFVPGTRGFIAPEQRTRSTVDGRSDVFALGLALHSLLTGYTPLRELSAEADLLAGKPLPLAGSLSPDLEQLIARAVAPVRLDRPTAAQLADEIGGALARRLDRDPRARLRTFLGPLRERQSRPGLLDQLLGLDVVASEQPPTADGVAGYELRKTAIAKAEAPTRLEGKGRGGDTDKPMTETLSAPARRARWWPFVVGAVVVGGALGVGAWRRSARDTQVAAVRLDAGVVAIASAPTAVDAGVVVDAAVVADAASLAVAPPTPRPKSERPHRHAAVADAGVSVVVVAEQPQGTGFLQIVGEDNVGAKIVVDGREIGYAPNKLEVARGHRHVEIVRKSGTRLAHDVEIGEYDTAAHPARPTF